MKKANVMMMIAVISALTLAGCGNTRGERALSGAGVGAGAGALMGAATGGSIAGGALLGGAAGAAVGGLTDKDTVNLDK